MKKQFSPRIYPEWWELLSDLPVEKQAAIFQAILQYPNIDVDCGIWRFIKSQIDKEFEDFNVRCKKNGEISRNYWKEKNNTDRIPNDIERIPNDTDRIPNDTDRIPNDIDQIPNDILNININVNEEQEHKQELYLKNNKIVFREFDIEKINSVLEKYGLSQIKILTDERKNKLKQRIKDAGGFDEFINQMEKALDESSFLRGDSGKWRADFDFFLQKSKWQKAVEGGYADKEEEIKWATSDWR
nr:MAG TPA: hypothetical protein [Caudoviricetes sp.]